MIFNQNNCFKEEKLLPENITDGLSTINSRKPKFHMSMKTHKPNDSSRPVITSLYFHTSKN